MKVLAAAAAAIQARRPAALVTIIGADGSAPRTSGARMLVYADGGIEGTIGGGRFEHKIIAEAIEAIQAGSPRRVATHLTRELEMYCGGAMEAFIEPLALTEQLVIHGAGHVGRAVATAAQFIGFAVSVIDDRPDQLALVDDDIPTQEADSLAILDQLPRGPAAYHLVMTYNHQRDQDLVERLIDQPLAWLGLLGSRTKVKKFFVSLEAKGVDPALFQRLSGPVGLDIGAQTPAEIAISVAAELVRVRHRCQRPPIPLSEIPLDARHGDGRATPPALAGLTDG